MTSGHLKTAAVKRMYISIPKRDDRERLSQFYPLDHGLLITDLNPNINEGYLHAYFKDLGFLTRCKIWKIPNSGKDKAVAFVRFSTDLDADRGDWAGPHCIAGTEVKTRRVVSPKIESESEEELNAVPAKCPPRRSMGLGYILEDPNWLEEEDQQRNNTL